MHVTWTAKLAIGFQPGIAAENFKTVFRPVTIFFCSEFIIDYGRKSDKSNSNEILMKFYAETIRTPSSPR